MASKKDHLIEDVSIISSSVRIEGDLFSEGNVRIDGVVNGNISVNGNLTIGEGSKLNGAVKAKNVTMNGSLTGKVLAEEKLRLESKATLRGDLVAKALIVEEGALFQGFSNMENQ